jgi:hypothetical protein
MKTDETSERLAFVLPAELKERFIQHTRRHGKMSKLLRQFVLAYCEAIEGDESQWTTITKLSNLIKEK